MPDARALRAWDEAHVWHPFTAHSVFAEDEPLLVVRAEGHYLIDDQGRRYLDGVSSLWCSTFGHRVPEIDAAIKAQLDRVAHSTLLGHLSPPAIEVAKRLADLAPNPLNRVFFSDNGSTSVEVALKMAYQYWRQTSRPGSEKRRKFLALENAYHGDTLGAVSVGGISIFHETFTDLVLDVVRAPCPNPYRRPAGVSEEAFESQTLQHLERLFTDHGDTLAAAIIEPGFQGAAGILTYPKGFLAKFADLCHNQEVLLVFDEVAVGMGRSTCMFACEKEDIVPDFLCVAKGLTGGYLPVAATLTTDAIFEAFLGAPEQGRTFFHGHTYSGNALGCAAALATLKIFEDRRIIESLPKKAAHLAEALAPLRSLEGVGDVRQYGLSVGIELSRSPKHRTPFPAAARTGHRVCRKARDHGVFLRPLGDVVVLMPPLTITPEEIDSLVSAVRRSIEAVVREM
jgi:adenosylmethionine---8-amino-7-oxononanoate aminotransferase